MITDAWIHGTFATFDYFNTQYLFSVATILKISSLLGTSQSQRDGECFEHAGELLQQLAQSGNLEAKEFCEHMNAMKKIAATNVTQSQTSISTMTHSTSTDQTRVGLEDTFGITAEMALADPSFQDFLTDADLDFQTLDESLLYEPQISFWPET